MSATTQGGNTGGLLTTARGVASTGINLPVIGSVSIGAVLAIGLGFYLLFGRRGRGKTITIS